MTHQDSGVATIGSPDSANTLSKRHGRLPATVPMPTSSRILAPRASPCSLQLRASSHLRARLQSSTFCPPAAERRATGYIRAGQPSWGMIAKSCGLCPLAAHDSYWTVSAMASCVRIWLQSNDMHLGAQVHSAYCAAASPEPDPRSRRTFITSVGARSRSWGTNSRTRERISVVTVPRESQLQL